MVALFCFQGKYFDTFEEFSEYAKTWYAMPITEESIHSILENMKKEIMLNVRLTNKQFTNLEFSQMVDVAFNCIVTEMHNTQT